ncbi:MAG: CRISPR-associated helicase Cas3' [Candidatus Methanospirareceae archaeon]
MQPLAKAEPRNNPKYFQTVRGHTIDSLKILNSYIETNLDVIEQFCNRWNLDPEAFFKSLFLTVYLHDVGKLTQQFQENIRNGKHSQRYPHAFYGLFILNEIDFPTLLDVPLENAAIMGHHTQLYSQLYSGDEDFNKPLFLEEEISSFVKNSKNICEELAFNKWFSLNDLNIKPLPEMRKFWGILRDLRSNIITELSAFDNKEKLKSVFCYIFSILETCDDYSSAEFSDFITRCNSSYSIFDSVMEEPTRYLPLLYVDNPYDTILNENTPYDYQKDKLGNLCGDVPSYGLLFAPCGRGKTEAALIWALKALKKYRRNKIVFAMPTQITSNAMWERFCEFFGKGNGKEERIESGKQYVGLFHGKSFTKLKRETEREKEDEEDLTTEDLDEIRGENFKGNVFFKPITVTTIDHLIYAFIHGFSQADFALGNLQNAVIVFDEVHYYEKQTLEHIMTLLGLLKEMQIPHLLMSGTLPEFFIQKVKKINAEYQGPFTDDVGLKFEPFKIAFQSNEKVITKDRINEEVIAEIGKNYNDGLIQFIILNTIERSKFVYETLIERLPQSEYSPRIVLHHSQFTYKDREEKERKILQSLKKEKLRPFILVATQVIEISLDISCDIMYTELAPGDALGQRGGRLNRKGRTWISNGSEHTMKVFMTEELDEKEPKPRPYDPNILKRTIHALEDGPTSYLMLKNICDGVYSDCELITPTSLKNVFNDCSLFGYRPYEINFGIEEKGRLIQIRSNEVQKFDVIPWSYYADDESKLTVENQAKVPLWWYKHDIKENGEPGRCFELIYKPNGRIEKPYWICKIPYNKDMGFDRRRIDKCTSSEENIV